MLMARVRFRLVKNPVNPARFLNWLPFLDTYRRAPDPAFRRILEDIRELRFAA
jgi:hypothetical protein